MFLSNDNLFWHKYIPQKAIPKPAQHWGQGENSLWKNVVMLDIG
ncbi:hypothetical protein D082_20650 [Synechocystis sp. PCC 6714]|nr:hypothetical protein D082_20650 [Synechocystis sp. PCC 6714]